MSKKKGGPAREKKTKLRFKQWMLTDPICDMKWEDDDGKNGEWLGCEQANGYTRIVSSNI